MGRIRAFWQKSSYKLSDARRRAELVVRNLSDVRSVVFLNHSYYNYYYLAQALRRRGWRAISVNIEPLASPDATFYHGHDVDLFDEDTAVMERSVNQFLEDLPGQYRLVHFYGKGRMSFFPWRHDKEPTNDEIAWDFLELRRRGVRIAHSTGGCYDLAAQSSFGVWSGGACNRCPWQHNAWVCSDLGNLSWGHKVWTLADWICTETDAAIDFKVGPKVYRGPLTAALDPEVWRPDLEVPASMRLPREPGELIIYHGFANAAKRSTSDRNLKGTPAVIAAVERLRQEGYKVRLEFVTGMRNLDVRFVQVQADIIVDQLNYGRHGATGREGLMLGKPTISHLIREELVDSQRLAYLDECTIVPANEMTIYDVLKDLVESDEKRRAIGEASRACAMKWWSADACAERYERVYDWVMSGRPPGEIADQYSRASRSKPIQSPWETRAAITARNAI
jgi:hypothetical protein